MEIIRDPQEIQRRCLALRQEGKTIGFVPTMGYLHEGHLSLLRRARKDNDILVLSIFVNPTQFGPQEDYEKYPRDTQGDLNKARQEGTDITFLPEVIQMYPPGYATFVTVEGLTDKLCGRSRPNHFRGVTTVVLKLFNLVQPHRAYFGEKDYQQLVVVRRMVKDLNLPIEIVGMPTVREADGLAMSSRNAYLNEQERLAARCLFRSLEKAEELIKRGERRARVIREEIRRIIEGEPGTQIDYISVCHPTSLEELETIEPQTLVALAVKVGPARLIDNRVIHLA